MPDAASGPSLARRALDYLDWRINPVLLRDLRLYMRGKLMLAVYFLTLACLVMMAVLYTVIARFDGTDGTGLLSLLTTLLTIICGAMVPNLAFERFRSELSNRATELALTSPLTPARLVRGKLFGAWCMTFMVVSAAAPMLATAYLLGGINVLSLAGVVAGILLAGMTVPMLQLSMAADFKGGKGLSRGLAALLFVVELVMMISYSQLLNRTFIASGRRGDEWFSLLLALVVAAILIAQFLYCATVGVLRGEAEDRDLAPRLSLAAAAVLGPLFAMGIYLYFGGWGRPGSDWREVLATVLCLDAYAFCLGFTAVCQSSPIVPRNLVATRRTKPLRSLFLLPGNRSLTAYFLLSAVLLLGALMLAAPPSHLGPDKWWKMVNLGMAPFMAIAYGMVVYRYLVLPLVKNRRNPKLLSHTIGIVNIIMALVSVFTMVMISYILGEEALYAVILGLSPVGLVTVSLESNTGVALAGNVGLCVLAVLGLLLLRMAGGREPVASYPRGRGNDA